MARASAGLLRVRSLWVEQTIVEKDKVMKASLILEYQIDQPSMAARTAARSAPRTTTRGKQPQRVSRAIGRAESRRKTLDGTRYRGSRATALAGTCEAPG